MRLWHFATAAAMIVSASVPAHSQTTLIAFDDNGGGSSNAVLRDTSINHAVQWTQTIDATNVTLQAILAADVGMFEPVPASLTWYVTNAIGAGTTAANIIATGTAALPTFAFDPDFDNMPMTTLATGLDLSAGTYYLVFDGPLTGDGLWYGDFSDMTTTLAPGFSVGSYYAVIDPDPFAPASNFFVQDARFQFAFELTGMVAVPEPETWLMLISGLGFVGMALRRQRRISPPARA